ncbi:winged helix family transcriptional regulator [Agromyces archimandritae]|uniref:Winged helix-turn-helix domain-containing protein n=1 Tax=Agromyces archimandritae TaxID=2781962 RepID=A0A975FK90_9MICO|nr:winged helix family transcriptional regulator [Agromyces archimandritae]QTX03595.1 winged helix-turn-helix domain-containing protein [Agromyces archimandritae]
MPGEPVLATEHAFVVCVGLPLHEVAEIAAIMRNRAAVLVTADVDGARALLGPPGGHRGPVGAVRQPVRPATGPVPTVRPVAGVGTIVRGPLVIDLAAREVTIDGRELHPSIREFDLLAVLAAEPDRVWSFEELTERVWHSEYLGDTEPIMSAVKRLRRRLTGVDGVEIASIRGVGYRLRWADDMHVSEVPARLAE